METLITPFGKIKILIDGKSIPYIAEKGRTDDKLYPELLGRYQIAVQFTPDGKEHNIACIFESNCSYKSNIEGGDRLECQSFYNDSKYKMSIGVECEAGYVNGVRYSKYYDYDAEYLTNGIAYLILPDTKTERYVFGIAWIDDVDYDDTEDYSNGRDVQTWFGADPTLLL